MDNDSYDDSDVYVNCHTAPDVIVRQPVTTQPSDKPAIAEPVTASRAKSDIDVSKTDQPKRFSCTSERIYSLDVEQTKRRDWTSELFFSITGNPHTRTFSTNAKKAIRDCCCMPCMMCNISTRLGDPAYLPFLPATGTAVRFKVRILGRITGSLLDDCIVSSFCWPCAVCQMHRELDEIGI